MSTVLVTGGAGFIGTHLCKKLLEKKQKVICVDNFYSGSKKNIAPFLANPRFSVIEHDVRDARVIDCDFIYHLACPASPVAYQKDPVFTIQTNIFGTFHMLDLARRNKAKILFTSTSEVYGDPKEHPQKEAYWGNVNPIGIRSCYDEGKRLAETACMDYHRKFGVNIAIVRIFNTYGPNMACDDGRVVSNFIIQALLGGNITIYGDGTQTRSFCYVSDMVDGLVAMMEAKEKGPINLGNPGEFTVKELAQKVIALTRSSSKIKFLPLPQDDPKQRQPDISLAKKKLGWTPKVALDEGLKKTIIYFQEL